MAVVPDVSAIISLAFEDEDAAYADKVIEAIVADQAVVPALFWFEIRNALVMGERRRRNAVSRTAAFLSDLSLLPFEIDYHPREAGVLELARGHAFTVYDAAYQELAQRKNLPLATVDRALIRAAEAAAVPVWKERASPRRSS